jgi:hypothetical protein
MQILQEKESFKNHVSDNLIRQKVYSQLLQLFHNLCEVGQPAISKDYINLDKINVKCLQVL